MFAVAFSPSWPAAIPPAGRRVLLVNEGGIDTGLLRSMIMEFVKCRNSATAHLLVQLGIAHLTYRWVPPTTSMASKGGCGDVALVPPLFRNIEVSDVEELETSEIESLCTECEKMVRIFRDCIQEYHIASMWRLSHIAGNYPTSADQDPSLSRGDYNIVPVSAL